MLLNKFVLLILISLLVLLNTGCGKNSANSSKHIHNTEQLTGHAYYHAKFTYSETTLKSKQDIEVTIEIVDIAGSPVQQFEIAHEKLMHFIIVSKDLTYFEHIHPEYQENGVFKVTTKFPTGGDYTLFAEFVPKSQDQPVVKSDRVAIIGESEAPAPLEVDTKLIKEVANKEVSLQFGHLMAGMDLELTYSFRDVNTKQSITNLQPYLGALGHVIIISEGAEGYIHVHPMESKATGPEARFVANFPESGTYKIWGQFKHNGKEFTVPFTVEVP